LALKVRRISIFGKSSKSLERGSIHPSIHGLVDAEYYYSAAKEFDTDGRDSSIIWNKSLNWIWMIVKIKLFYVRLVIENELVNDVFV